VAPRPAGVELLRAAGDRRAHGLERYVWATVEAQPVMEQRLLHVPRRGAQPARDATLALRFCRLTLCPPRHRKKAEGLPEVSLWAVHVREIAPPAAVMPLEWLLLTTGAVQTAVDASERVAWYACRWGIEVWHRILTRLRAVGDREMAGTLLCHPSLSHAAGRATHAGRGRALDRAARRLCGPTSPRPPGDRNVVAGFATSQ
jgi:hypothetical protein